MLGIKNFRAPVLVVIATLDDEDELGILFLSHFEGLDIGIIRDVIVTDGGSDGATLITAENVGCLVAKGAKERGEGVNLQRHIGCKWAWVLILHADTVLEAGWSVQIDQHFHNLLKHGILL